MKNILTIILTVILFTSCGSEEEYPITYTFDKANEISSVVLTADNTGEVIEIDKLHSLENLGLSPFEFFTMTAGLQVIKSITIDSETDLTIDFGMDTPVGQVVSFPYTDNEVSQFGLIIEEDKISQRACFDLSSSPTYPSSLNANRCDEEDAGIAGLEVFTALDFSTNDTLAYSIIEYIYLKEN
ncbi:MAG: hypothetical protein ACI86M_000141 [Saprospiraceae bacterium]|jgi:hypothetical protein